MYHPGTFSQIYIQLVFAVQGRRSLISEEWEEELYKYITGIITNKNQKLLAINGAHDHIHILIGTRMSCCPSDLMREIKKSSNLWINDRGFARERFNWQMGGAGFSYSRSQIGRVIRYIENQKLHHQKVSFKKEYTEMLIEHGIEYDERFLFEWIE